MVSVSRWRSTFRRLAQLAAAVTLAGAVSFPAVAADQADTARFDLVLRGLTAGQLTFAGNVTGQSYAVTGRLKSSGLLSLVKTIRYDASATGRVSGGVFTPARYVEKADTGKRKSEAVMDYEGGVPQVKTYNPPRAPRPQDIDPATQGGTVDPLTALFVTLRDIPAAEACQEHLFLFDGRRRSQVTVSDPVQKGDGLVCQGEYRRLEGFSDKDMAEKTRFPFEIRYDPAPNGLMRVTEISMDTLYGKGRLTRR